MKWWAVIWLAGLFCGVVVAQDDSEVGLLPDDKRAIIVPPTERNPFTKKEEPKVELEIPVDDLASEENQIRDVLNRLDVVGRTRGENGWKVLLGDLILENGTELPPVIVGQTQTLRVVSIFDRLMEIEWVMPTEANEPPKKMFIPIALEPQVSEALGGRAAGAEGERGPRVMTTSPAAEGNVSK